MTVCLFVHSPVCDLNHFLDTKEKYSGFYHLLIIICLGRGNPSLNWNNFCHIPLWSDHRSWAWSQPHYTTKVYCIMGPLIISAAVV